MSEKQGLSDERAAASPAAHALAQRIAAGDYYEALGISSDATGREILAALMPRRREFPGLDQEWNAIHTSLTQQRARYDAARSIRDEIVDDLIRHYDRGVSEHLSRQAVWQQLWDPQDVDAPLALRKAQVMSQAQAWQHAEESLARARQALSAEFGQEIWPLLDAGTNWQQVRRNLPDLPQALEAFAEQLPTSGRELASKLPEIEISAQEAAENKAQRLQVYRQACPTCQGTRRVQRSLQQAWRENVASEARTVQELSEVIRRYQRGLGALPDAAVSVPCPDCTHQVVFEVPPGIQRGWVLCGKDPAGERHFARLAGIQAAPAPQVASADEPPAERPMTLRDKIICGLIILVYCAGFFGLLAVFTDWLKPQAAPASSMTATVRLVILAAGAFLLWFWYRNSRRR